MCRVWSVRLVCRVWGVRLVYRVGCESVRLYMEINCVAERLRRFLCVDCK